MINFVHNRDMGYLSSISASISTLGDSGWLIHIQNVLAGFAWIAARVAIELASVLVHCRDGWERTSQLVDLASLLLDPCYLTTKGFQALVGRDCLAFGHRSSDRDRAGMASLNGSGLKLPRQSSRSRLRKRKKWWFNVIIEVLMPEMEKDNVEQDAMTNIEAILTIVVRNSIKT